MNASIHNITTVIWGPVPDPLKTLPHGRRNTRAVLPIIRSCWRGCLEVVGEGRGGWASVRVVPYTIDILKWLGKRSAL